MLVESERVLPESLEMASLALVGLPKLTNCSLFRRSSTGLFFEILPMSHLDISTQVECHPIDVLDFMLFVGFCRLLETLLNPSLTAQI
jgi:hypothetical protein